MFERWLIRERQREGIALAKKAGVYRGRKPSLTSEQAQVLRKRVASGEKKAGLAREFGISREDVICIPACVITGSPMMVARGLAKVRYSFCRIVRG